MRTLHYSTGESAIVPDLFIYLFIYLGEVRIPGVQNKIYYEPDSGDDWDDEDPDEDLDL